MMRRFAWILFFVALILSRCVPADFENPLSDPKSAEMDQNLLGLWVSTNDAQGAEKDGYEALHINKAEDDLLQIILIKSNDKPPVIVFKAFVTKLPDGNYLNLQHRVSEDIEKEEVTYSKTYWIAGYEISINGILTLSYFDDDKAETLIEEGRLEGSKVDLPAGGTSILVTSSTSKMRELIHNEDHENLFVKHKTYRRILLPQ